MVKRRTRLRCPCPCKQTQAYNRVAHRNSRHPAPAPCNPQLPPSPPLPSAPCLCVPPPPSPLGLSLPNPPRPLHHTACHALCHLLSLFLLPCPSLPPTTPTPARLPPTPTPLLTIQRVAHRLLSARLQLSIHSWLELPVQRRGLCVGVGGGGGAVGRWWKGLDAKACTCTKFVMTAPEIGLQNIRRGHLVCTP